jgi:RNA ligase (TIGR02306 family)
MSERQLATIREIAEIRPIEGADAIEAVRVDGWWVVAKKGEYSVGQLAVYLEIDSWVPDSIAPFLTKPGQEPKEFEGVKGQRLRTVKLRGQISQGLLLPLSVLAIQTDSGSYVGQWEGFEGHDVTERLGILKWERPLPAQLAGMAKGNFPSFIPKTDQPRVQNCGRQLDSFISDHTWEITEKLDGSSMTVYVNHSQTDEEGAPCHGVCSRNLDLKFDENNSFWQATLKERILEKIKDTGLSIAIQGELIGEGIQGNSYKIQGRQFFCFDIWDIESQRYLMPEDRRRLCSELGINHVPVIAESLPLNSLGLSDVDSILSFSEGKSSVGSKPEREGFVFKSNKDHDVSFKAISNKWLLKGGE